MGIGATGMLLRDMPLHDSTDQTLRSQTLDYRPFYHSGLFFDQLIAHRAEHQIRLTQMAQDIVSTSNVRSPHSTVYLTRDDVAVFNQCLMIGCLRDWIGRPKTFTTHLESV